MNALSKVGILLFVFVILLAGLTAFGQEAPAPTPAPVEVVTPDEPAPLPIVGVDAALEILLGAVSSIVLGSFAAAPITTLLVSFFKRIPPLASVSAPALTLAVATVLWITATGANLLGYTQQFNSLIEFLTAILPNIIGIMSTILVAPMIFDAMKKRGVPIIGFSRTPPVSNPSELRL